MQRIRVEHAKRLLERDGEPVEEISWAVGYEDPASFRRLFKRLTGLTRRASTGAASGCRASRSAAGRIERRGGQPRIAGIGA